MNKIVIVGLCLVLVVTFSGCIEYSYQYPGPMMYDSFYVSVPAEYTGTKELNLTEKESQLNAIGFVIDEGAIRNYTSNSTIPELNIFTDALNENNKTTVYFNISYYPSTPSRDDEYEQINITTYIKTRADEVAKIFNLTLDWHAARWTWSYSL
ncbi:MAG: hypothetical protein WC974_03095 [Thermoplasmata archaeon]